MKILTKQQKENLEQLLSYPKARVSLAEYPCGDKRASYLNGLIREYIPEETLLKIFERYEKYSEATLSTKGTNNVGD